MDFQSQKKVLECWDLVLPNHIQNLKLVMVHVMFQHDKCDLCANWEQGLKTCLGS